MLGVIKYKADFLNNTCAFRKMRRIILSFQRMYEIPTINNNLRIPFIPGIKIQLQKPPSTTSSKTLRELNYWNLYFLDGPLNCVASLELLLVL